jgi:hypothetical protein
VISRTAGDTTVTAMVEGGDVYFIGEQTAALLDEYRETADYGAYVTQVERDAIDFNQTLRNASSVIVPVNPHVRCDEYACVKLEEGLRAIVGRRIGDGAMMVRALRFSEPRFDLTKASEYAIRWGFVAEPLVEGNEEARKRKPSSATLGGYGMTCANCGSKLDPQNNGPVCANCGMDNTAGGSSSDHAGMGDLAMALLELVKPSLEKK